MANELSNTLTTSYSKNGVTIAIGPIGVSIDVAGNGNIRSTVSIGTTDETLDLGDVATIGWVYLRNLDATNYITFGLDGTNYSLKLKPLEFCLVRWNGAALHAKAHTAACLLEYCIIED